MICALVVARVLGPETYGVISAATVYVLLTTLLLDQGLAVALVQRPNLSPRLPGAVAMANLVSAAVLAVLTWVAAPAVALFFSAPGLAELLRVLAVALVLKGVAITPRAMLQRRLAFPRLAVADVAGGLAGALAGITAALQGAGTWSLAWQVVTTDAVVAVIVVVAGRGARPNFDWAELRTVLPFSLRVFGSNALAYLSRNSDNILVGRFLGVEALSLYSMAYRVLVIPVQMIGQTVNRVSFPTLARLADQPQRMADQVLRTFELLAFAAIPSMGFAAVASPELVRLVLGDQWLPAAPLLSVLAVAGARETIFSLNHSVMRAKAAGTWILRYEFLATGAQVAGIVIGLKFGVMGVAIGYASVGFALTPVLLYMQSQLTGLSVKTQLGRLLPPVHATVWSVLGYLVVRLAGLPPLLTAVLGLVAFGGICIGTLLLAHRRPLGRVMAGVRSILRRG